MYGTPLVPRMGVAHNWLHLNDWGLGFDVGSCKYTRVKYNTDNTTPIIIRHFDTNTHHISDTSVNTKMTSRKYTTNITGHHK